MALSNAERQRRHIERLKARAAIGEQTVTNIVPAVNGGLPDEVTDKDSADYRLMHATLNLAAALAEADTSGSRTIGTRRTPFCRS